jgi:hypothetical protein
MAVYELTVRFEAEDDTQALAIAAEQERMVTGEWDPPLSWRRTRFSVERVTRVIVTRMPAGG